MDSNTRKFIFRIGFGVIILILLIIGLSNSFILKRVDPTEMAIITKGGKLQEVVGAGTYSQMGFLKKSKLETFSVAIIPLNSIDPEVLTKPTDNSKDDESSVGMPVGFEIVGDIQIPTDPAILMKNWARYGVMYKNPEILEARVDSFTKEAMKVCGGSFTFYEITALKRVEFATCISNTVTEKVEIEYSVRVTNVTIANIILSDTVLARINAVIDLQQQVDLERQQGELAKATGARQEAENTATIQAKMATSIEQAKQNALLAEQEALNVSAQTEVVQAKLDLIALQQDLADQQITLSMAEAVQTLSEEARMAEILQRNPNYYSYLVSQLNASALQNVQKMLVIEEGSMPQIVMGVDPVYSVNN